jgi:hypothetical protein
MKNRGVRGRKRSLLVLRPHFPLETEVNQENSLLVYLVPQMGFVQGTYQLRIGIINCRLIQGRQSTATVLDQRRAYVGHMTFA